MVFIVMNSVSVEVLLAFGIKVLLTLCRFLKNGLDSAHVLRHKPIENNNIAHYVPLRTRYEPVTHPLQPVTPRYI